MTYDQSYKTEYDKCISIRKGHLLQRMTAMKQDEIWPEYAVSYCSQCFCLYIERIIDNVYYGVWMTPLEQKILRVNIEQLYYNEERKRMELLQRI